MSTIQDVKNLMQHFLDIGPVGCCVSINQGEETLFEHYCGYADAARTKALGPEHYFRMFSMTKVVAALCGLIQYERGMFKLDDPISDYLPEYKHMRVQVKREDGGWDIVDSKVPITLRHAFSMGVGMLAHDGSPTDVETGKMHQRLGGDKNSNLYDHLTETRALASVPMLWEPGTHFQYGVGLELMAAVVEVTSGMGLGDFMQKNIFDPLGMKDTGYRFSGDMQRLTVDGVMRGADGSFSIHPMMQMMDRLTMPDSVYECASTGLISTLRDYTKFAKMLACGGRLGEVQIVGRKSINLMRQNMLNAQQLKDFDAFHYLPGYGYGMGVRTMMDLSQGCNSSVGEFGWTGLMGTWVGIDPEEKTSVVYMHQMFPNMEGYMHPRIRAVANGLFR